jgi:hypothetical protein
MMASSACALRTERPPWAGAVFGLHWLGTQLLPPIEHPHRLPVEIAQHAAIPTVQLTVLLQSVAHVGGGGGGVPPQFWPPPLPAAQTPLQQVPLAAVQSVQSPPPVPHAVSMPAV